MKYHVNEKRAIGKRSPMLYGHFIEHFHRQIYDGIYDPVNCPMRKAFVKISLRQ